MNEEECPYCGWVLRACCCDIEQTSPIKKTKTYEFWVNCYEDGEWRFFGNEKKADSMDMKRLGPAEKITIIREI